MTLLYEHWNGLEEDFYDEGEITLTHPHFSLKLSQRYELPFHYRLEMRQNNGVKIQDFSALNPRQAFEVAKHHYQELANENPDES